MTTTFRTMNICVFSNIPNLTKELRRVLPSLTFKEVIADSDENLQNSEIIIGDFDLVAPHIYNLPKLKWLQGTWAGVDAIMPYVNKPLPFLLTRFSGHNFGKMMTEYIIMHIVSHERDFNAIDNNQRTKTWSQDGKIQNYRVISDLTIGILGIGNIGSWIGKCLNTLGAQILGYGRKPSLKISDLNNFIDQYYTKSNLSEFLKRSDYIINTLPTTSETTGLLNGDILQNCKERKSIFINVGRGTIIDENDLICALKNGWLSKAILDVFQTEPLPKDSPLWTMDQVKITPHVSAVSKPRHIAEQFQGNWKLYEDNQPIPTTVNLECGY